LLFNKVIYHSGCLIIKYEPVKEKKIEFVLKSFIRRILQNGVKCIIVSGEKVGWCVGKFIEIVNLDVKRLIKVLKPSISDLASEVAGLMGGYSLGDITNVICNARLNAQLRNGTLNKSDFIKSLETIKPLSLLTTNLSKPTSLWTDIGGHEEIKRTLLKTLKWPTLYPRIFSQSPLRPRTGILLYGYPGCGKTLLASSLARECNLNLITVNGPELLNKYIGESEKSTRDVFLSARKAKPCLLFFDEFESIAPRRGGDGVTDRVVNQILTEVDGAEGLEGVYVIGATTRPDLIDPALLRPGRLDKRVFVGMLDEKGRREVLARGGSGVDWGVVAKMTEGFSGADLVSLVASAQLLAIHETLDGDGDIAVVPDAVEAVAAHAERQEDAQYVIVNGHEHIGDLITRTELDQKVRDIVNGGPSHLETPAKGTKSAPKVNQIK
jgi:SpoVK/Ycf46/Vps4 family AAA+-type ATPase